MQRSLRQTLLILTLFVGSGCAALMYEVVWFQLLSLVIGASGVSLAILLAMFMGGMCLGSLAWPKLAVRQWHPLKVYAALELGIAVFGLIVLAVLPRIGSVYWSLASYGMSGIVWRGIFSAAFLLPPTFLMGATLPAVARWVEATRTGYSRLGLFYAANTGGAVLGTLATGFWLLRVFDVTVATGAAVAINLTVAFFAWRLANRDVAWSGSSAASIDPETPHADAATNLNPELRPSWANWLVFVVIAASGLTALGAEVVWTRLLGLLFGPSTYTFSIILAVFLSGLGVGSFAGAALARRLNRPAFGLAICQLLLVLAIPASALMIVGVVPHWFPARQVSGAVPHGVWYQMLLDLTRAAAALLPPTLLWGASFPLAVAAAGGNSRSADTVVGRVYTANTLGAIAGTLLFSLEILPAVGTQRAHQWLTVLAAASGLALLLAELWPLVGRVAEHGRGLTRRLATAPGLGLASLIVVAITGLMYSQVPGIPRGLIGYGRDVEQWEWPLEWHYVAEGLDSVVAVSSNADGDTCFHVSGKVVASNSDRDLRIERLLGHLPAIAHQEPKTALVIGCGAGVTAGSLLLHPSIERIVICEIERCVPEAAGRCFARENYGVIDDPRTVVVHDDARHFLAATDETFDVITTDPIHPYVRGAAALYTADFFQTCRQHLNPGGVIAQWVPLYESSEAAVKCELATLVDVFPGCTLWSSDLYGGGYDLVVLAAPDGNNFNFARIGYQTVFNSALYRSLSQVALRTQDDFRRAYVGRGTDLQTWLAGVELNRDSNLRLQYLAGLSLNERSHDSIFASIAASLRPETEIQFVNGFRESAPVIQPADFYQAAE